MKTVSVIFPVYNEAENLEQLYAEVLSAIRDCGVTYQLVFVDNGSADEPLSIIKKIRAKDPRVFFVSRSRIFGHQNALFAGMTYAAGDAVITMDADLQHPPSLLPKMIHLWREKNEVIYTSKKEAGLPFSKRMMVKVFYWVISKISRLKLNFGQSDFRLLDRKVVDSILGIAEYHKFLRGQVSWVGFKQIGLTFSVRPRHKGESKFSYKHLFLFALDAIFSFSRYPLHLVTLIGVCIALLSFFYLMKEVFLIWIINIFELGPRIPLPPGWTTLTVAIFFLGSVQLIAIGILGEYVGRIFDQTKGRPNFIVRERPPAEERTDA